MLDSTGHDEKLSKFPLHFQAAKNLIQQAGFGFDTAGRQAGIKQSTAQDVANLLTGGAAASAAGVVGAQSARTGATGNIFDLGTTIAGLPSGTLSNPFAATPPPQTFNQAPVIPGF